MIEHLDELVIKPTFPQHAAGNGIRLPAQGEARTRMIERIRAQPAYVAQGWVRLSQTPVWSRRHERRLVPRSVGLRMFAAATPNSYTVMPAPRVSPREGDEVVSMQRGGLSKDTWIRAAAPVAQQPAENPPGVIDLVCSGTEIPSRVGENLFWMGRYAERCEGSARVLRAALIRVADAPTRGPADAARCRTGGASHGTAACRTRRAGQGKRRTPARCGSDLRHYGSLAACLQRLSGAANQVRERLSSDNWHALNRLSQLLCRTGR